MFIDLQGYKIPRSGGAECFRSDLLRDRNIALLWSFELGLAAKVYKHSAPPELAAQFGCAKSRAV
jgi:hypothetical protein